MISAMNTLKQSTRLGVDLVREQALPLLILFGACTALSLTLEDVLHNLSHDQEDQRWMLQLGLGLVDLFQGVVQILMLSWGIPKVRQLTEAHFMKQPFREGYLNSFAAEYLRTLGSVLLHGLLLIIPGLVRYARLIFVPFITIFAKPYRDGDVDAFDLSIRLSRGRLRVILALVLSSMAVQAALEVIPQSEMFHALPVRLGFNALSFLISVWLFAFTYLLFERAMEEHSWT